MGSINPLRNPVTVLVLNFIIGTLAAKGYIAPEEADMVVDRLIEIGGLIILLVTSFISLKPLIHFNKKDIMHIIKHDKRMEQVVVKIEELPIQASLEPRVSQPVSQQGVIPIASEDNTNIEQEIRDNLTVTQ